jgi:hypothetical protein
MPSTEANAQMRLPVPIPSVVKEAARLPARSAWRVNSAVSGPGVTISSAATAR